MSDDLSDYERLRLENIRRNAEFLQSLGLEAVKPVIPSNKKKSSSNSEDDLTSKSIEVKKRKREQAIKEEKLPTRRSARLLNIKPEDVEEDKEEQDINAEEDDGKIDYTSMPMDSDELDDHEFQVFVALKKWRLLESRSLDIEPYKICQNRTIAELVRRKRNNQNWALDTNEKMEEELLECWGIGPAKAKKDRFGYQLVNLINHDDKLLVHLDESRKLT